MMFGTIHLKCTESSRANGLDWISIGSKSIPVETDKDKDDNLFLWIETNRLIFCGWLELVNWTPACPGMPSHAGSRQAGSVSRATGRISGVNQRRQRRCQHFVDIFATAKSSSGKRNEPLSARPRIRSPVTNGTWSNFIRFNQIYDCCFYRCSVSSYIPVGSAGGPPWLFPSKNLPSVPVNWIHQSFISFDLTLFNIIDKF